MRALSEPEFTYLDEPFSRLSEPTSRQLAAYLRLAANSTNIIAALLPEELGLMGDDLEAHCVQEVTRSGDHITFSAPSELPAKPREAPGVYFARSELFSSDCVELLDFVNLDTLLPIPRLMFLPGAGQPLSNFSGPVSIYANGVSIATCNVDIREGVNLLIGDNGAGKTLLSRAINGDVWRRTTLKKVLNSAFGMRTLEYERNAPFSVSDFTVFYIPPEAVLLGERTINHEMKYMDASGRSCIELICDESSIPLDIDVTALPYSFQKVLQLCLVPQHVDLVILDEAFGSLTNYLVGHVAAYIRDRVRSKDWRSCVVTSNRPQHTLQSFQSIEA